MNHENGEQREVVVLLSDEFAPRMPELAAGRQVWALRTADTENVVQRFWSEHSSLDADPGSGRITLFDGQGDPEENLLSILDDIELHHGIASSERPAFSVLRVLGASPSEMVRDVLRTQGFTRIESRPDGFIARWHRE